MTPPMDRPDTKDRSDTKDRINTKDKFDAKDRFNTKDKLDIKDKNDGRSSSFNAVLDVIRRHYPLSRNDIADLTGLSAPSVSRLLPKLFEEGYLEEAELETAGLETVGPGRKTKLITLKENSTLTAGAEYNGERLKVALLDEKSRIICFHDTVVGAVEPTKLCGQIADTLAALLGNGQMERKRLVGVGLAMPGIIDYRRGLVKFSAQTGWRDVALRQMLEKSCGVKCVLENDIKAAAYAEYVKGNAIGSEIAVAIYFGSGMGSAIIVNGQIFRGVSNSAGELGHITQDMNGTLCNCGKIGCLQTNIANGFLLQEAQKVSQITQIDELLSPDIRKEKWAERIINRFVTTAAMTVETVVCAYNPDTVILSGDLLFGGMNPLYQEICDTYYENYLVDYLRDTFTIKPSAFEGQGSPAGAGMLAAESFFETLRI